MGRSGKPDAVPPASTDPYDIGEGPEAVLLLHGFSGSPWELHPLAVSPEFQRKGVGAALVRELEKRIREKGGLTVTLGTDDEINGTNLYGRDLYPDVLGAAQEIAVTNGHPYAFYQKLGYVVTGLIPDANGFGRPDIIMCKRLERD